MQGMMMQYSEGRTANAVGGKTARACENCLRKRARWFCGADDAFLCQACDKSVHSANQLASRHERVRLETSSTSSTTSSTPPVWHQGFTRKARTPRHNNKKNKKGIHVNSLPLVPEIGGEESCLDENEEEELLYRVPVLEPLLFGGDVVDLTGGKELNFLLDGGDDDDNNNIDIDTWGMELISSDDAELAEFAADVESLLNDDNNNSKRSSVKIENDEDEDEPFSWDDYFDYSAASPVINNNNGEKEDMKKEMMMMMMTTINGNLLESKEEEGEGRGGGNMIARKISLKLNYEEVMNAWDNNSLQAGCPWINGTRPDFNPSDNSWPDFLLLENGSGTYQQYPPYGVGGRGGCRNEEREARVSRYREKRRTRMFSKKIRYKVRKLNAEKRPRMKGRFVKRTTTPSSSSTTFPNTYLPNY